MDLLVDQVVAQGLFLHQIQIYIYHPFIYTKRKETKVRHNLSHPQKYKDNLSCSQTGNQTCNTYHTSTQVCSGLQRYQDRNLYHSKESHHLSLLNLWIKVYNKVLNFLVIAFSLSLNQKMLSKQFFLPKLFLSKGVLTVLQQFQIKYQSLIILILQCRYIHLGQAYLPLEQFHIPNHHLDLVEDKKILNNFCNF